MSIISEMVSIACDTKMRRASSRRRQPVEIIQSVERTDRRCTGCLQSGRWNVNGEWKPDRNRAGRVIHSNLVSAAIVSFRTSAITWKVHTDEFSTDAANETSAGSNNRSRNNDRSKRARSKSSVRGNENSCTQTWIIFPSVFPLCKLDRYFTLRLAVRCAPAGN